MPTLADTYAALVLQDKPQAFWKMDDTTGLPQDSSGNGRHFGSFAVSPPAAANYRIQGPFDGMFGIKLDASSACVASVVSTATDNITWEAWVQPTDLNVGGTNPILMNGTNANGFSICFVASGSISYSLFQSRANGTLQTAGTQVGLLAWHYLVVVRNNGTWQYYRDGLVDLDNAGSTTPNTPTSKTQVGPDTGGSAVYSNIAYYNKALPLSTIFARYRAMTSLPDPELRSTPPRGYGAC